MQVDSNGLLTEQEPRSGTVRDSLQSPTGVKKKPENGLNPLLRSKRAVLQAVCSPTRSPIKKGSCTLTPIQRDRFFAT